jgi:nucleotide-binding universal stress UspA family protein
MSSKAPKRGARFRSLLVAIDLTPGSDRVLGRLRLLPLANDGRVTILHVVPGTLAPRERREAERQARQALASEVLHLRQSLPETVRIHSLVALGAAAKEIAAGAARAKAELIVMGRGGGRALRDAFLGSTAERVLRQTRLPVLVVRLAPRAAYVRPALALDLDQAAQEVLRFMLRLLPPPRPGVTVIHAFDFPYSRTAYTMLSQDEAEERKVEFQSKAAHELAGRLRAALTKANVPAAEAPHWKMHVRHGSPRLVVPKAVRKADTDLLVLGTRGYSGPAHAFLGTVAGDVLREVKCDVLVVPPSPARG